MFFLGEKTVHLGVDRAAGDRVDLDIRRGEFFCESHRESVDAAFCRGICRFTGRAADSPDGGDIDDLASCGYHVVINCARSTERMEEVKKEVETLGAECLAVQADVGNPEDCKRLLGDQVPLRSCGCPRKQRRDLHHRALTGLEL